MKPIALVTQRQVLNQYGEPSDILMRGNVEFIRDLGFAAVAVPNDPDNALTLLRSMDYGLLFVTGGGFVPEEFFVGDTTGAQYQLLRDDVERILVADAITRGIPIYALCRGMFMVNGILGGKVLRGGSASKPRHDHYVTLRDGAKALVNTYHNSAVPQDLLAPELEALAWETGTQNVEAYRSVDKRILGLQWHPERPLPSAESITVTERLFDWLLNGTPLPEHILEAR